VNVSARSCARSPVKPRDTIGVTRCARSACGENQNYGVNGSPDEGCSNVVLKQGKKRAENREGSRFVGRSRKKVVHFSRC